MNEAERKKIQAEAEEIMNKFAKELEKVKFKEEKVKKPVGGFREEGAGQESSEDFRKRMFDNAPEKKGDFIIAEKKKW